MCAHTPNSPYSLQVANAFDESNVDCSENPMLRKSYRSQSGRLYYINVGRNIARDGATTHFILVNDIELYPSVGLVPQFLRMMALSGSDALNQKQVYVIPPFEVTAESKVPKTKTQLQQMLEDHVAFRFHRWLCDKCHRIPDNELWEINSDNRGTY